MTCKCIQSFISLKIRLVEFPLEFFVHFFFFSIGMSPVLLVSSSSLSVFRKVHYILGTGSKKTNIYRVKTCLRRRWQLFLELLWFCLLSVRAILACSSSSSRFRFRNIPWFLFVFLYSLVFFFKNWNSQSAWLRSHFIPRNWAKNSPKCSMHLST